MKRSESLAVAIIVLGGLLLGGCSPITFTIGGSPADQKLESTIVQRADGWTRHRIAVIDVSGLIRNMNGHGLLGPQDNPVALLHERLVAAQKDSRIKAVILRINSPGGTVAASDTMYREVKRFGEQSGKPVVALLMDVAASGGYYVACSADKIVAQPTTITGSVGVLMQTISVKPALARIGVQTDAIVSGPNKDAGSPLSTLSPEQRAILQGLVDEFHQQFVAVVAAARPQIDAQQVTELTDGRVLTGRQAEAAGLVDQTGDLTDAVELAKQLAGIDAAHLVIHRRPQQYVGSPYAAWPGAGAGPGPGAIQVNLAQINLPDALAGEPVGFYYLWDPTAQ